MSIVVRSATDAEVAEYLANRTRVRFRHFVREVPAPRAANGVAHRQYTTAKIATFSTVPDVQPFAMVASGRHKGEKLTGTHCTLPSGRTFVGDIRIASAHLPSNI